MASIITAITDVFDAIGGWITGAVTDMVPMFYAADTGLTFLGVLAVTGLAMSVAFLLIVISAEPPQARTIRARQGGALLIGIIQRFLHFAG